MKVLITGAAGFIGGNLMGSLRSKGTEFVGLDNFSNYYSADIKQVRMKAAERISPDLFNYIQMGKLCDYSQI